MPAIATLPLGTSGLSVPRIVLGAMAYGSADDAARVRTMHAAFARGVTAIDTAPLYEFGRSEALVGRAIADRRDRVQVLSKVGLRWDDDARGEPLLSAWIDGALRPVRRDSRPAALRADVDASLRRLAIERIDLCQIHHPDRTVPIADTIGTLVELHRAGKVGAIGVSNFDATQLAEAHRAAGSIGIASHQLPLSLLRQHARAELLALAGRLGHGTLCYSPLAHGVLGGRGIGRALDRDDGRGGMDMFSPASVRAIGDAIRRTLVPIAARHDVGIAEIALAWVLAQPGAGAVVVGASAPRQIDRAIGALAVQLAADELAALDDAFAPIVPEPAPPPSLTMRARGKLGRLMARLRR